MPTRRHRGVAMVETETAEEEVGRAARGRGASQQQSLPPVTIRAPATGMGRGGRRNDVAGCGKDPWESEETSSSSSSVRLVRRRRKGEGPSVPAGGVSGI